MLDPDYLLRVADGAEEISAEIHSDILRRIVRRMMARIGRGSDFLLTAADKWQIEVLQDAGYLAEDIQKILAKKTRQALGAIQAAFRDAGVTAVQWDNKVYQSAGLAPQTLRRSPYLQALMEENYSRTAGLWRNYTRTLADQSQKLFISECDHAYNLVSTNAVGYWQAVREAVNRVAKTGVRITWTDPDGQVTHTDTIETATARAVRTGVGQACNNICIARMKEMDWDIVLTSAHLGARVGDGGPNRGNHYWWQGKFYSLSGKDPRFPPFEVCGMGYIDGFGGVNCRHSIGPGDGEHNPFKQYDAKENAEAYARSQKQRLLERRIRKTRREALALQDAISVATDPDVKSVLETDYKTAATRLRNQNHAYEEFCEQNGLKPQYNRLEVSGWGPQQERAAMKAARK